MVYNPRVNSAEHVEQVRRQLHFYEHPLFAFEAKFHAGAVEVIIRPRFREPQVHTYRFELHARDLDNTQFEWTFQRQLYDALHDYLVEMFTRTPQFREDRERPQKDEGR